MQFAVTEASRLLAVLSFTCTAGHVSRACICMTFMQGAASNSQPTAWGSGRCAQTWHPGLPIQELRCSEVILTASAAFAGRCAVDRVPWRFNVRLCSRPKVMAGCRLLPQEHCKVLHRKQEAWIPPRDTTACCCSELQAARFRSTPQPITCQGTPWLSLILHAMRSCTSSTQLMKYPSAPPGDHNIIAHASRLVSELP